MVYKNVGELIGNTPLVKINKLVQAGNAEVFAKLEKMNVGGSIKDRLALYLLREAEEKHGDLQGKILLEATSGSTGIALAMLAAVKGYRFTVVMPASVSVERRKLIEAYGAKLILSPGERGTGGALELKEKMLQENPEKYVSLDQHASSYNAKTHFETTGQEIWRDTEGCLDMLVVAIGTGGTGMGAARFLKKQNSKIQVVGVTPALGVSLQGLRNPREPHGSQIFEEKWFDEIVEFSAEEIPDIYASVRELARQEGILAGMSSGAVLREAQKQARILGKDKRIVTIFPDSGERYLSTDLFG